MSIKLCLAGDVMLGRGVDQSLAGPHANPTIFESSIKDARHYALLSGIDTSKETLPEPWGDLSIVLRVDNPDAIILNLETALTAREPGEPWNKGINYRAHPSRALFLNMLPDPIVASLANNHVLDWGIEGLIDTLQALDQHNILHVGAGRNLHEAQKPATLSIRGSNVSVWGACDVSSGVPREWAATASRPGVWLLGSDLSTPLEASHEILSVTQSDGIKIVTLHHGPNWAPLAPDEWTRRFAHHLIDGGIDVVHFHSSHHPRTFEVYKGRLIVYGQGDLINDYEGISEPQPRVLLTLILNKHQGQVKRLTEDIFFPDRIRLRHKELNVLQV